MEIYSFDQFIGETKFYIYHRMFRVIDLSDGTLYTPEQIELWKNKYNFDQYAHCMFVSKEAIKSLPTFKLRTSSIDLKNIKIFNADTGEDDTYIGKFGGYLIPDSEIIDGENTVYLYVFQKNSNEQNRARQIHGFIYENSIIRLNQLKKLTYIYKWDAEGSFIENFLEKRVTDGKIVEFFSGTGKYKSIDDWNQIPREFKVNLYWNIKCTQKGQAIETADFKRISGLIVDKDTGKITISTKTIDNFIFVVGFHDGTQIGTTSEKNIVEEYLILVSVDNWKKCLPDIEENLSTIEKMYKELIKHKLVGKRTTDDTKAWEEFMEKYRELTKNTPIKITFKRDTKGQLRIQSQISYTNFNDYVLKNPHIRIL